MIGVVPGSAPAPSHRSHAAATLTGTVAVRPENDLVERDLDGRGDIRAAGRTRRARRATEDAVAEERGEDVRQVAEVELGRVEAASPQPGVAEAVVRLPSLRVGEHLVGLRNLAEAVLGVRGDADVGMQLAGEPAKGLLDVRIRRVARHAEHLVVVRLRRRHPAQPPS